ncbi:MAG: type II toxin-antitoxin system HigB family toxin [Spirochaetes bacterium]|jgi:mRNA interferase HigB|nr:type II toxin-antitoxin system HigB family toxin [Spirochaetota bacterium]
MRVISHKKIVEFGSRHNESRIPLNSWYKIVSKTYYNSFAELKRTFPGTDYVDGLFIFNIGGNKYRLIAAIHFNTKMIYIRHVLTHEEYDKNKWKE